MNLCCVSIKNNTILLDTAALAGHNINLHVKFNQLNIIYENRPLINTKSYVVELQ